MEELQRPNQRKKTSMSVREMGQMLGLKKVESYWLVQKGYFKTITAGKVMRVMIDSFEDWYSKQFHYRKVNGEPPGQYYSAFMSVTDIAIELGIDQAQAYNLVTCNDSFRRKRIDGMLVITKRSFETWYRNQLRYTKTNGAPPGEVYEGTMSAREMSEMLGIPLRNTGYYLIDKGCFRSSLINGQRRINIASFEEWYSKQSRYKKVQEESHNGIIIQEKE